MKNNIQLRLFTGGLDLKAELKHEALVELLVLIQKHRVEEQVAGAPDKEREIPFPPVVEPDAAGIQARDRLKAMSGDELSEVFSTLTSGEEKLLALIGWLEASSSPPVKKVQVRDLFVSLGKPPPANSGRDMKNMVQSGLLHRSGDRQEIMLGEAGWQRLSGVIPSKG